MKKIVSLIAGAVLAFGFVSCSGDLHDIVENPYIPSSGNGAWITGEPTASVWKEMTVEDGKFTYSFTYDANGAWGGAAGESHFTICSADNYDIYKEDGGYRWQSGANATPDKAGELAAYEYDNHCVVSGLTQGRTYKISASLTTTGGSLEVAEVAVPDYKYLFGFFAMGSFNNWSADASYLLAEPFDKSIATGDVVYKVEFTAPSDSVEFAIGKSDWSTKYTAAEITLNPNEDATESVDTKVNDNANNKVTGLSSDLPYYIVVTSKLDGTVTVAIETIKYIDVKGCRVINYEDDEGPIYFLEEWIPGNAWGDTNPHADVVDGKAEVTFDKAVRLTSDTIALQMVSYDGSGSFWDNKVGGGTQNVDNPKDFKTGYLVFDCEESELTFVPNE